jgi:C4-dicarboxylate-specific signal transduction histidine kinase
MVLVVTATATLAGVACWRAADREIANSETQGLAQLQIGADAVARQTVILVKSLGDLEQLALGAARLLGLGQDRLYATALAALRSSMANSPLGVSELSVIDRGGAELLHEGIRHGLEPDEEQAAGFGRPWKDRSGQIVLRWSSPVDDSKHCVVQITLDPVALSRAIGVVLPDDMVAANGGIAGLSRIDDYRFIARSQLTGHSLDENLRIGFPLMGEIVRLGFGSRRGQSLMQHYDMMASYRTLPEFRLIASAALRADDMMALARLRAQRWRVIPFAGLAAGLVIVGGLLFWTDRRRARAKRAADEQARAVTVAAQAEINALAQSSPALLFRGGIDAQGTYRRIYSTENSNAILGWEAADMACYGQVLSRTLPEERDRINAFHPAVLRDGRGVVEYRLVQPDGSYRWLRSEAVVVRRHQDGSADVVGSVSNVTREHELAAQALIQNRMATVGEISTSIAHELSQPMTVISMAASYARMLAEQIDGTNELGEQIDAVVSQSKRAGEIIQQLRRYGHAGGGALGPVDLWKAASGAMVLAGRPLAQASVAVEVDLPRDLPIVRGRLVQVEQVLMNLMLNARDAMMEMPANQRRLLISAEIDDDVVIHVADSGQGVPATLMDKIFEPFFTTKDVGVGTGLGLALCRTMMEEFGGSISLRNADQGAVFSLRFVRAVASPI